MPTPRKRCAGACRLRKLLSEFPIRRASADGHDARCKICKAADQHTRDEAKRAKLAAADEKTIRDAKARADRLASDYASLKPDDFADVDVGNDGRRDPNASRDKRQEFSRSMGEFAEGLARGARKRATGTGDIVDGLDPSSGTYIANVGEQERRFQNRRVARSLSLAAANEALALHQAKLAMREYLSDKIRPVAFSTRRPSGPMKRSAVLLLSDLHLGAELDSLDEPMPFRAIEEARRLEFVLRQLLDFKPQHRKDTEAVILLNGDVIEGKLEHSPGGAPLAEQKVIFWRYMREFIAQVASRFPAVRVYCQPGNHGRDLARHPGRATSRKWDSHEWEIYYGLMMMASGLANVTWDVPFRAASLVPLHGQNMLLSHGDTEVKIGHPDKTAERNTLELIKRSAARTDGGEFTAAAFGHFHTGRLHVGGDLSIVYNGALVPPNGYARGIGAVADNSGQFLWEAVEGHPVGDVRFLRLGRAQDEDRQLGTIITPFRFNPNQEIAA